MYCSRCAAEISEDDVYCPKCHAPVASFSFSDKNISQVEPLDEEQTVVRPQPAAARPPSSSLLKPWMIASIAVLVIALLGSVLVLVSVVTYVRRSDNYNAPPNSSVQNAAATPSATPTPTPTPTPKPKVQIVDTNIPVAAGHSESIAFTLDARSRITGGYVVDGGSDDIDVEIVDSSSRVYYGRPASSKAKVDITLPPGSYQMVFSNKHAWFTSRTVAVQLFYQEL
jgi:hypothetical protein